MEASSSRQSGSLQSEHGSDHVKPDALQHLHLDDVYEADQQLHADSSSPASLQQSTSPNSTLRYAHHSSSPVGSNNGSKARETLDDTQADSALFTQLELLHQECQEKEALINKLSEQLADWEELHAQLQEKESLNRQYVEALQAAESTIAYLTACSLDSQGGFRSHSSSCPGSGSVGSDAALHSRCIELQKALQEKEDLNNHLIELLNMAEKAISSSDRQEKNPEIGDLCLKIETALQQGNASSNSPRGVFGSTEYSMHELQRHADSLQEALLEQNRLNAELKEKLWAADAAAQHGCNSAGQNGTCSRQIVAESLKENESRGQHRMMRSPDNVNLNQEMTKVLVNCLNAAESAIASLAAHCTNSGSLASGRSSQTSPDLQMYLDKLQKALQEREELRGLTEPTQPTTKFSNNQSAASAGTKERLHQELHHNLCLLYKVFSDHSQRISELQASLQEERVCREASEARTTVQDAKGLPPNVQVQLETLHKALREKKKACKSLEEKLATAQSIITKSPETAQKGKITLAKLYNCAHRFCIESFKTIIHTVKATF